MTARWETAGWSPLAAGASTQCPAAGGAPRVSLRTKIQLYESVGSEVRWRLLSGNNREMGRGTAGHRDGAACLAEVERLADRADSLALIVRRDLAGGWHWTLILDDVPVARSCVNFARRVRCQESGRRFQAAIPLAQPRSNYVLPPWQGGQGGNHSGYSEIVREVRPGSGPTVHLAGPGLAATAAIPGDRRLPGQDQQEGAAR